MDERKYVMACVERMADESWNKRITEDDARVRLLIAMANHAFATAGAGSGGLSPDDGRTGRLEGYMKACRERLGVEAERVEEATRGLEAFERGLESGPDDEKMKSWKKEANHRYKES